MDIHRERAGVPELQGVRQMARYFSYSNSEDIKFHDTEDKARARAAKLLEAAQDGEVDVDECRSISWGEVREATHLAAWVEKPEWIDDLEEDDYTDEQRKIADLIDWSLYDVMLNFKLGPVGTPDVHMI
jgi:hypothetical protein